MIYLSDVKLENKYFTFNKILKYQNNWSFIPLLYDNNDFIVQTPLLYNPFGINIKYDFIDLSIRNIKNDKSLQNFYNNLKKIIKIINMKIESKYSIKDIFKKYKGDKLLRIKTNNDFLIFDQNKKIIDDIPNNSYGNYIIHFSGLWINKKDIFLKCNLLQAKMNIPLFLKEYSFIDTQIKPKPKPIPPPPPLPVFKKTSNKIIIPKSSKYKNMEINNSVKLPTLNDIKDALKNLKSI